MKRKVVKKRVAQKPTLPPKPEWSADETEMNRLEEFEKRARGLFPACHKYAAPLDVELLDSITGVAADLSRSRREISKDMRDMLTARMNRVLTGLGYSQQLVGKGPLVKKLHDLEKDVQEFFDHDLRIPYKKRHPRRSGS